MAEQKNNSSTSQATNVLTQASSVAKTAVNVAKAAGKAAVGDIAGAVVDLLKDGKIRNAIISIVLGILLVMAFMPMAIGAIITAAIEAIVEAWTENWDINWEAQGVASNGSILYLYSTGVLSSTGQTVLDTLHDIFSDDGGDAANKQAGEDSAEFTEKDYENTINSIKDQEALLGKQGAVMKRLEMIKGRVKQRGLQIGSFATTQYALEGIGLSIASGLSETLHHPFLYNGIDWQNSSLNIDLSAFFISDIQALKILAAYCTQHECDLSEADMWELMNYCCMSDMHETMKFLATLFFSFLFLDLVDYADTRIDRRLPVPVNVILEEAANIGEVVNLQRYLATARSRAISITLILQSLGQLQEIYGEYTTKTILNTCSIHACIGTNDEATANHFEWLSGTSTIQVKTEQHPEFESPFKSRFNHSTGDGKRSVFTSNEIRKIRRGYILLCLKGYDTLMCRTFGINQHPEYKKGHMTVIEPHTHVPLANTEACAFMRAMEEQRVKDYEEWEQNGGFAWEGYDFPEPQYDGPSRGTPAPKVIPYPELEKMALAHAEQANAIFHEEFQKEVAQHKAADQTDDFVIELPPDLEWLHAPIFEEEPEADHAEPEHIHAENPVVPTPPPIVMPEQKRKFDIPTDAFTPPTITQPKKSDRATLYGKQIPKQK